ncbi:hypothetical protein CN981_05835 [Priestia megaterium]|nr:hypothetical protein CN981_05835 [Priestia megaterium]
MLFSLFRGKSTTTKERSDKMEVKIRYVDPVALKKLIKSQKNPWGGRLPPRILYPNHETFYASLT